MTYNSVTVWQAAHATYMFIWTPTSSRIGVIRIDEWGVIQSHGPRTREFARRVYRDLLWMDGKVMPKAGEDTRNLPDYKRIIHKLLQEIQ